MVKTKEPVLVEKSLIFTENEIFNKYEKRLNSKIIDFLEWTKKEQENCLVFFHEFFPISCNKRFLIEYNEKIIAEKKNYKYITFRPLRNVKHCLLILDSLDLDEYNDINLNELYLHRDEKEDKFIFKSMDKKIFETKADSEVEARLIFSCIKIIGFDPIDLIRKTKKFDKKNNVVHIEEDVKKKETKRGKR